MLLTRLRTNGRCVEIMEFNGSMNVVYLMRFRHISHMLSHYAQLSSSMHARLFGSMQKHTCLSGGARNLRSNFCLSLPVYMHFLSSLCAHGHNDGSKVCV